MNLLRTVALSRIFFVSAAVIGSLYMMGMGRVWQAGRAYADLSGVTEANRPRAVDSSEGNELERRICSQVPRGLHIIVDTSKNRLYLKRGGRVLREAVVSTGSGSILRDPNGARRWVFDTPRGEFRVQSKVINPLWVKPDWAFIEEGKEIPTDPSERIEEGVLGSYALGIGNGYFIHGTLYTRMLGRNITHGCIRVNDEDLKAVYQAAPVGTPVFIY